MEQFSVVYDACVLYSAPLRDLLVRLALTDLFKARWTDQIHEEWIKAVSQERGIPRQVLERTRDLMDKHALDAKVSGYEHLIDSISLPDPDDRHVVAAAIHCRADAIITFNLKDFPEKAMQKYKLEAIHPDDFICYQIDLAPPIVCNTVKRQCKSLQNPPKTPEDFLITLQRQRLPKTASMLEEYVNFI